MVLAFSLLLQSFGCNGFIEAVIQRKEIHHRQVSTLFWINAAISLVLALLFFASAPLIAGFYKEPLLKPIVAAMSLSIIFGGLSNQHVSLLARNMQFYRTTANELMAAFISLTAAITLAWCGWGYWALVAKWVMAPLMITIGAWIMCGWRPCLPARRAGVWPLLTFAFHTYGNFIMSYFRRNLDKIMIGRSYGGQSLGAYDRAYHLSSMLPSQIINPLFSVAVSTFSKVVGDPEKYRYNYLNMISIMAFVGMPLSTALALVSKDVILLLLGPQWDEAGQIFLAFAPSIGIIMIYITHGWLHLSLGTPDRWFRWSIIEFVVTVLCFIIGLPFGSLGIAISFTVSFYILLFPALWYAGKPIQLEVSSVLSSLWKYYVAALVAGSLCWFIFYSCMAISNTFMVFNIIIRILIPVTLSISLYIVLIIALHRGIKPIFQFISVLHEMIPNIYLGKLFAILERRTHK